MLDRASFVWLHKCNDCVGRSAFMQYLWFLEKKQNLYDINILNQMRFNGTIVAVLIIRKKIRLHVFAK